MDIVLLGYKILVQGVVGWSVPVAAWPVLFLKCGDEFPHCCHLPLILAMSDVELHNLVLFLGDHRITPLEPSCMLKVCRSQPEYVFVCPPVSFFVGSYQGRDLAVVVVFQLLDLPLMLLFYHLNSLFVVVNAGFLVESFRELKDCLVFIEYV